MTPQDKAVSLVEAYQGLKSTELVAKLGEAGFHDVSWPEVFEALVKKGRLTEVEYTLPAMPYRVKSFYMPGGTNVSTRKANLNPL